MKIAVFYIRISSPLSEVDPDPDIEKQQNWSRKIITFLEVFQCNDFKTTVYFVVFTLSGGLETSLEPLKSMIV
jgi:hypothetical protein